MSAGPAPSITTEPIRIAAPHDNEGRLVFVDGQLAAVLVRLSSLHGEAAGAWFVEAAFGALDGPLHPTFADLDEAQAWLAARLKP